jgi:hypothetical protein
LIESIRDPLGSLLPTKNVLEHQMSSFIKKTSEGTTPSLLSATEYFPKVKSRGDSGKYPKHVSKGDLCVEECMTLL